MGRSPQQSSARFQWAKRRQMEWRPLSLDLMLPEEHTARLVWAYVEALDLSEFYERIRAVEGQSGRDPIDPRILLALWLYALLSVTTFWSFLREFSPLEVYGGGIRYFLMPRSRVSVDVAGLHRESRRDSNAAVSMSSVI
jgi:hypothetical protein